tara:strand:+ start:2539 stop:2778 length:240 start_codon:yes stop_codon:yes gene_type:complete
LCADHVRKFELHESTGALLRPQHASNKTDRIAGSVASEICMRLAWQFSIAVAMKHYTMLTDDIFPAGDLWFYLCKSADI